VEAGGAVVHPPRCAWRGGERWDSARRAGRGLKGQGVARQRRLETRGRFKRRGTAPMALVGASGGEAGDGPSVGARTASTGRSKEGGVHGLQDASVHVPGEGAASGCGPGLEPGARARRGRPAFCSDYRCSKYIFSKFLNRSATCGE
jgi:hypothetical protein